MKGATGAHAGVVQRPITLRGVPMDIGQSISYIFADRDWLKKVLIFGLLFFIPIIGWLLIGGYVLRLLHNVITGEQPTLPEWNNWGGDLAGGLKALVVGILWGIPIWVLEGIGRGIDSSFITFIISLISFGWGAVTISAISDLAVGGNIADALNMRPLNRVLNNIGPYAIYVVMSLIFSILAMFGLILVVIGVVFTIAIAAMAITHLGGQAYRIAEGRASTTPAARF